MRSRYSPTGAVLLLLALGGCREVEEFLPGFEPPPTPRESYVRSLEGAGLAGTALVEDWTTAGDRALAAPVTIASPFAEEGYLAPHEPAALGWRFAARRGQAVAVDAAIGPDTAAAVFVDVFEVPRDAADPLREIANTDTAGTITFEPRRDAEYIVRIQPELLRGGRYTVRIRAGASLAFPVQGRSSGAIQSFFGDVRDGGARDHHGVDIFAPRGTPVLAAARGYVRSVRETGRGGKVVWLNDEARGLSLYYAHLDSQLVERGEYVEIGDTLGLVGNSGNARSTPPHLHFGIYRRGAGPADPWWYVHSPDTTPARLAVDTAVFGDWTRTAGEGVRLRTAPDDDAHAIAELPRHTALRVIGGAGGWFRIALPDGTHGFVAARLTEDADRPLRNTVLAQAVDLTAAPAPGAAVIINLVPGDAVPVIARFGDYLLVRKDGLPHGWLPADS
jgi:murein DD-endopeptidase MepM/ murein hydrolase activator NlpD